MAYEDLTTWTEEDDDGEIVVNSTSVTMSAMNHDSDCQLYLDGGADIFIDTLHHYFELTVGSQQATIIPSDYWYISNSAKGYSESTSQLSLYISGTSVNGFDLGVSDYASFSDQTEASLLDYATKYYIEIVRTAAPLITVYIRTGSHTGVLKATLSGEDGGNSFRYLHLVTEH